MSYPDAPPENFDVVIIGAGISGSVMAKMLGQAGIRVLVVEAGEGATDDMDAYLEATVKVPSIPFLPQFIHGDGQLHDPTHQPVGRPVTLSFAPDRWQDVHQSYYDQKGPLPFTSGYERLLGGTARSWMGVSLRMLPADFRMHERYGLFTDWPVSYGELSRWYDTAERELSVSGDIEEQSYSGVSFSQGYEYPNPPLPSSYFDRVLAENLAGLKVDGIPITVTGTPSARLSKGKDERQACRGSSSCIPLCPTGARYSPLNTLKEAVATGNVTLLPGRVVTRIDLAVDGSVESISVANLALADSGSENIQKFSGEHYVLAGNAIESARLLLLSAGKGNPDNGVANSSDQVGRNLMDHPMFVAWGLMPQEIGAYRGPMATSGVESFRDGAFRSTHPAFRVEVGNVGWNFAIGDPDVTTIDLVTGSNRSGLNPAQTRYTGTELKLQLRNLLSRQFHMSFEVEQAPNLANRVKLSSETDGLGLARPEIHYDLCDYTRAGFAKAVDVANAIFTHIGADQRTDFSSTHPASIEIAAENGPSQRVRYFGAGHIGGTCRMGIDAGSSVVDQWQRSWDHRNLMIVGSASFPTFGTANPTLTIVALCMRSADWIIRKQRLVSL